MSGLVKKTCRKNLKMSFDRNLLDSIDGFHTNKHVIFVLTVEIRREMFLKQASTKEVKYPSSKNV